MRRPRLAYFDAVAALALLVALPGAWIDRPMFFASWLAAWWFCMGLVLGVWANALLGVLTGGRWAQALRMVALLLAPAVAWLLLAFLPLAAGLQGLYPWAREPVATWTRGIDEPGFTVAWHGMAFFAFRLAVIGVAWFLATRPAALRSAGRASAALIALLLAGTVAAIDLLMSLLPGWYSTVFGMLALTGGTLGGAALAACVLALAAPGMFPTPPPRRVVAGPPPVWRDLGNLLMMWVLMWAYLAFVEFLVIWAEDLPREIAWYVPRLRSGWVDVGRALMALQFGASLVALLWRRNKDDPRRLAAVAGWLMAGQLLNCAWLVLPSVAPHDALGWWLVPALALAIGLPVAGRVAHRLAEDAERRAPEAAHA